MALAAVSRIIVIYQQHRQRQVMFKAEDGIMDKRDALIESVERRLTQHTAVDVRFSIRWAVT